MFLCEMTALCGFCFIFYVARVQYFGSVANVRHITVLHIGKIVVNGVVLCTLRCVAGPTKRFTYFMRSRCATDSVGYWIGNSSFISFGRSLMIVRTAGDTHIYIRFYHKAHIHSKAQHTTKAACNCLCILIPGRDLPYMRCP